MTEHLSKADEQVVADEADAEKLYQAGLAKQSAELALDALPYQTQQLILQQRLKEKAK